MKKFFSDRKLLLIAAITLAVTLPFANKAFHIDDPTVLDTASHILSTPAKPYNFDYNWMGARVPMSEVRMHPPLQEYFAAFLILITGGTNEIIFHIIFAVFPLILAYSCYFLTKRFSSCPLFATLLIMLSPAVMVNSHNVMNDIPSLALFTAGVAIYVYGADNKNKTALLISALPIFCAMGITYQAFAIIPLLFIYSCLKKRMSFITILPLLIASGLILLFLTFVSISSDNSLFSGIIKNFGKTGGFHISNIQGKTIAFFSFLGGAISFPVLACIPFLKKKLNLIVFTCSILSAIWLSRHLNGYNKTGIFIFICFFSTGLFLTVSAILQNLSALSFDNKSTDKLFLLIWFAGFGIYNIFFAPFGATRYLLMLCFPIVILIVRELDSIPVMEKMRRACLTSLTVLTGIISLSAAVADFQYAGIYRDFAENTSKQFVKQKIWFTGEWGFRYYMEQNDAHYLYINDNRPQQGDIVVIPSLPCPTSLPDLFKRMTLKETVRIGSAFPMRIMNNTAKAAFYSHGWGFLPYSFSPAYLEEFRIYTVEE